MSFQPRVCSVLVLLRILASRDVLIFVSIAAFCYEGFFETHLPFQFGSVKVHYICVLHMFQINTFLFHETL